MVETDLRPWELGGRSPDVCIAETLAPVAVDRVAHHPDVGAGLHDERVRHVRLLPLRLEEDPHETEGVVDLVLEARESDPLFGRDRNELPTRELFLEGLHVVRGHEIDLVHDDQCLHVDAISREDVDELVLRDVLADDDRAVQVPPFPADVCDQHLVELRQLDRRIHPEATTVRLRQGDIGGTLVQPDPRQPQFFFEDIDMGLEHVDHEENQVAAPGHGEDFFASTATLRSTADQPRHVEDLDLRAAILKKPWNHVQRGEVVGRHRAVRIRNLIQQRRLADGRESDETGGGVPALLDRITRSSAAPLEASRLLLVLEPGEFRFQPADVVLSCLVVRCLLDLILGRLDLFFNRHRMPNRAGPTTKNLSTRALGRCHHTVRMPSGSRPFTAYSTIRRDLAVYGERSRPPSTRWRNSPTESSISFSSANVYARTDAVNSRAPLRSRITWRVSNRPRNKSNEASSRTTVPSSRACQDWFGRLATRLSRLNISIRNFPRGWSARAIPRRTSRSSSGPSKYPNDVNMLIAASNEFVNRRRRMSPSTNVGFTWATRAAFRASARSARDRSKPVMRYPRFASPIVWRPDPHATSRIRLPFRRWRSLSIASTWASVSG